MGGTLSQRVSLRDQTAHWLSWDLCRVRQGLLPGNARGVIAAYDRAVAASDSRSSGLLLSPDEGGAESRAACEELAELSRDWDIANQCYVVRWS